MGVDVKIVITIIIVIMLMYFTTLEHLKAGIKGEELLLPRHCHMDVPMS